MFMLTNLKLLILFPIIPKINIPSSKPEQAAVFLPQKTRVPKRYKVIYLG